ncbi:hypothetical protein CHM34_17890 [Paludifilum halophilum]|uniref:DUF4244 domain-containing protein n=1 Tax=Paludifilum halophilum TaxID=1642702 RepID=A0A235B1E6_9BACL|nr:hypothetical protein CHM34_17890 [Paludifilum halophilum]
MAVREKSHRGGADVRENPSWWNKKGASTPEYVVVLAAAALMARIILYSTLTSDSVAGILKQKIEQAINGEGAGEGNHHRCGRKRQQDRCRRTAVTRGVGPSHPGRKSGQGWQICGPIRG